MPSTPERAAPEQIVRGDPVLARFQPIGLSLSKCYRQSDGSFSCITCHDPHARAASSRSGYDQVCLKCHDGAGAPTETSDHSARARTPCPVSPREGCVECHMPRVDVGDHLLLSDHWIRVKRDSASAPK